MNNFDDNDDDIINNFLFISSGIVDVNNIAEIPDATTLNRLAQLKADITANVITGSKAEFCRSGSYSVQTDPTRPAGQMDWTDPVASVQSGSAHL